MSMFVTSGLFINPAEVAAVYPETRGNKPLPFCMTVTLKSGKEFTVSYGDEKSRDTDARRLAQEVGRYTAEPVTRSQVEDIVGRAKEAVRRDVKALRQTVENPDIVHCVQCKNLYFKDMSAYCRYRVGPCQPD